MNIRNFIKGVGSVMDIFPTSGYTYLPLRTEFDQKKDINTDDNILEAWLNVGDALRHAMSVVDGEKGKE
ncbi:MAG: hypothetical protein HQL02_02395 [Nitrospirae bacterium]|nr:hypothetical protein [Nitrospirota bacterium]